MEPSDSVLRGLLEAAPDALIAVDPAGRIVFVNEQAEWLFGWQRADLLDQQVECLVPERFRHRHPKLRDGYALHPTTRPMAADLELWARRQDGSEFPAEISLSSFLTPEGRLVAVAIRDATVARRNEQRFRAVLAAAPDATIGVTVSGKIDTVNAQAERLFGWSAEELIGAQVEVLVPGGITDRHIQHRANYIADSRPRPMGADLQLSALRKDGTTVPVEISLSTVSREDGDVMVLAAVRDIRDRIELEAERQRAAIEAQGERSHRLESLGQLAGGVAHDFNNLLGVILNYTTLLRRRVDDATAAADLDEIRAAAERGAALTAQLLTFARRDVVHREPIDVTDAVRSVASMLERTLGEHIELRLDLGETPVRATSDRSQLEQILLNLAINARDAMAYGGILTITARQEVGAAGPATLTVTDTGGGMTPEVKARAFEPFFTTKPRGRGTGLGLATVYGIVHQSEGEITIESAVGEGTSIVVQLPGAAASIAHSESRPERFYEGHERILLVEDEAALRIGTARLLEDAGYHVITSTNGVQALDLFVTQELSIDILVTDVAMPLMRGDELALELKKRSPRLPVVFMTGYDSGSTPLTGRVLDKPVGATELLRAVREVLDE
jgi:PAS domain S-box-containing protein